MEQHANVTVFLGRLNGRIAHLAAVTATKVLSAILALGILGWLSTAHAVIPASQRTVLTDLYTSTNGAAWTNKTNWNGAVGSECTWFGVGCDATQSNVVIVQLRSNNLVGTLPALSALSALQTFDAGGNFPSGGNFLTGPIPSLTGLTALQFFLVQHNKLTGAMPSLTGLTALQNFAADNNQLTGFIPSLNGLTALRRFSVLNNQLTGAIPSLTGLTALEFIDLSGNFGGGGNLLTGPIPSLTGLTNLSTFSASFNQLTGTIPSLTGLTNLSSFNVFSSQLTGPIPALTGLTALQFFLVDNNQLTGTIPSLSGLSALISINASQNQLTGTLPSLTGFSALQSFQVSNNQLTGPIPSLTGLTALQSFGVGGNQLTGPIPSLTGLTALLSFQVVSNQLTGPVPTPPVSLLAGQSRLCANNLTASGVAAIDAAWNTATGVNWQACQRTPTAPVCELLVSPSAITAGRSSNLTASCIPAATAFSWTGGSCPGTIGPTCIVTPTATTTYSVAGSNAGGAGKPVSGTVTIVAPVFPLTVTNTSTPTVANVSAALQFRPQDVPAVNNVYAFAYAPAGLVRNVPADALTNPKGPVVSSTRAADGPAACVLAQLLNGELKFASTSTLQPFLSGVLGSLGASVNVLNGVSTVLIGGAVFYVGYGTDPTKMIVNGTNQTVATIPGPVTCLPQTPQNGWWWYPLQDGRGFGIEVQGNTMFMSGYLYDSTGHATWMVAEGKVSVDGSVFSNKLYQVANGQSLTGAYKAPGSITFPGDITLSFTNARSGTLIWPGGIIPIQRFDDVIGGGNGVTPAFVPESGWWWNATESGRGYFIEIKNNYAFIAGYMYEADGRPVWYIAEGAMSTPQLFSSRWYEAANGQTLTGAYKKPNVLNGNVGSVSIQFLTTTTATLTLPDGRLLSITRQRY